MKMLKKFLRRLVLRKFLQSFNKNIFKNFSANNYNKLAFRKIFFIPVTHLLPRNRINIVGSSSYRKANFLIRPDTRRNFIHCRIIRIIQNSKNFTLNNAALFFHFFRRKSAIRTQIAKSFQSRFIVFQIFRRNSAVNAYIFALGKSIENSAHSVKDKRYVPVRFCFCSFKNHVLGKMADSMLTFIFKSASN